MPKRIQMHRRKGGWRKDHPDAVIVARPTNWGNPYVVGQHGDQAHCCKRFANLCTGMIDNMVHPAPLVTDLLAYQDHLRANLHTLHGKDLACWCALDAPCHADVLLELANKTEPTP